MENLSAATQFGEFGEDQGDDALNLLIRVFDHCSIR